MKSPTLGLCTLLLATLPLINAKADVITLRFSHVVAPDTPKGKGALLFQQLVAQRLAGQVQVEVLPNGTAFDDANELQALQDGKVDILAPAISKLTALSPKLKLFDLPFLFENRAALDHFQTRPSGKQLLLSLEKVGIIGLAYWPNGLKQLSARKALREPGDAKGLVFRIQNSDVLQTQFEVLGASAVKLPFNQTLQALANGTVNATENTWSNYWSQRLDQQQRYFTETNHGALDYLLIVRADRWRTLPFAVRSTLEEIIDQVTFEVKKQSEAENQRDRARIAATGGSEILTLTPEQRARWREAMRPVWQRYEGEIGAALLKAAETSN
ncbi:DctP family TRAP transporter solute-binding subunit [Pseudomonas oryzihabitans]|uniref:C4-dicarboxylate-binding protein DctP n=1 Tax=Pseudomonas oryzihabitans TaxID=47885 RepID=A0AAJ2BJR1_9PSED|nr:DctP family TRAP transporter solute-binding subunit [Pseudomonas psychrotolerans]MDR6235594.1 C4-dicarboxylate-binding protein DctP [Pseudomonas psychrotolerans]MDR6355145.1 C4-dicarboxylate-binding protein DctP [Pseudomonas psychrotolerans]